MNGTMTAGSGADATTWARALCGVQRGVGARRAALTVGFNPAGSQFEAFGTEPGSTTGGAGRFERELRDRLRAALLNSGFEWPQGSLRIGADVPLRVGDLAVLDLPAAMGVLCASGQLPGSVLAGHVFVGALGLDGTVAPAAGALVCAAGLAGEPTLAERGCRVVTDPQTAGHLTRHDRVVAALKLDRCVAAARGDGRWASAVEPTPPDSVPRRAGVGVWAHVAGTAAADAAAVCAAGGHHLVLMGGTRTDGQRVAEVVLALMGDPEADEAAEIAVFQSACGLTPSRQRPLRAPAPHTPPGVLWGASRGGEAVAAHRGVLLVSDLEHQSAAAKLVAATVVASGRLGATVSGWLQAGPPPEHVEWPTRPLVIATTTTGSPSGRAARAAAGELWPWLAIEADMAADSGSPATAGRPWAEVVEGVARSRRSAARRGAVANAELAEGKLRHCVELTGAAQEVLNRHIAAGALTDAGAAGAVRVALTLCDLAGDPPRVDGDRIEAAVALRRSTVTAQRATQSRGAADMAGWRSVSL